MRISGAACSGMNAEGIFMLETIFGPTLTLSTRWIGQQHVKEDLGFTPSFADWMRAIRPLPWMGRAGGIPPGIEP